MVKRKLQKNSYSNKVLLSIAQIGMIRRSEISQLISAENEKGEIVLGVNNIGLKRGVKRLRDSGYIDTVRHEEKDYYYVTKAGQSYLQKYYPTVGYKMDNWNMASKSDRDMVAKRSIGLYLYNTMGLTTLPSDKPSLATFFNKLIGKNILKDIKYSEGYNQNANVIELFSYGVFYDIQEIRDTLLANDDYADLSSATTSLKGILINAQEIIFVYQMKGKRTVTFGRVEKEFVLSMCHVLGKIYEVQNPSPEFRKVCNVIASDLRYLPTLVTGKRDGIQKKEMEDDLYTNNKLSAMSVKRMQYFDKIQIVPQISKYLEYRGCQYDYDEADYNADLNMIIRNFPEELRKVSGPEKATLVSEETGEDFIVCRYPDAKELYHYRRMYIERDQKVSVFGLGDLNVADYISRSLQGAMNRYYSIETMKEIPIAHYNEKGFKESADGHIPVYIDNLFSGR